MWSLKTSYQTTDNRFSSNGQLQPLGDTYTRKLNWKQILTEESSVGQSDLRNYMSRNGVKDSDVAAVSTYQIQSQEITLNGGWAYGLMDGWMIGFRVPVTHRTTRAQQSVEVTPGFLRGPGLRNKSTGSRLSNKQMQKKVRSLAEKQLNDSGYDAVPEERAIWSLGDVSLMSQETLAKSYNWTWGLQQLVRFPTSQHPGVNDYIHSTWDDGQTDLGLSTLLDYRRRRWLAGLAVGYVVQLRDSARMQMPGAAGNTAGDDVDPMVRRDLGDWFWASVDTEISVARRWTMNVGHSLLSKQRDSYKGKGPDPMAFDAYAEGTDQQLQESKLGFLYRMGAVTTRAGIQQSWNVGVDYSYPWIGKNSADASQTSLELINYF